LEDDGLVFRMMPPDYFQAQIGAQEVRDGGQRRVALLYRNDPYGAGLAAEFAEAFGQLGGQVVADVPYEVDGLMSSELGSYDFDVELDAVFSANPDTIYLATFDEVVQISRRIEERGDIAGPNGDVAFFGSDSLYDPAVVGSTSRQVLDRLRGTAAGVDETSEDFSQFALALEEAEIGQPWSAAAQLYDAVYVFALAMQAANSKDPSEYKHEVAAVTRSDPDDVVVYVDDFSRARDALLSGKKVDYQGASGPIELNEAGDPSAGAYLIWRAELAADGAITFETEKIVTF
jgi:branched-chain amino acid transport system substrate-binding protein